MPVLTCGGMRFMRSWNESEAERVTPEEQHRLEDAVERAVAAGITHIETARGYGTSEAQLGRVLPRLPRARLIVQTKIEPCPAEEFLRKADECFRALRLDYVDLLAIHGINNEDLLHQTLRKGGALEGARKLQREGRCRFVGFSTHGSCQLVERAIATEEFDYVNLHWYFVHPHMEPAVATAGRYDLGVLIISPNDKGGHLYKPSARLRRLCRPLSPMQFNLLYCLAREDVHTLSIGVAQASEWDEHIAALAYYPRRVELATQIAMRLEQELERTLGREWWRHWWKGIPEWSKIPGQVNVFEIVRLWNYAVGLGLTDYARSRYNLLGQAEHWFPGRNAAQMDEAAVRRALAYSPFADRIVEVLRDADRRFRGQPARRLSQSGS